ncbi:MAG: UDP-N-acetylmuramyl-tripeptide synthetase [Caldiserica bacterium]|nr:UDP-N-acetylmuramyl-tripeptide synthetase [Caldisericota bacterium]
MKSRRLLQKANLPDNVPDFDVSGIVIDSREAGSGKIFVALRGTKTDGHRFIQSAFERGSQLCIAEEDLPGCIKVADTKNAYAMLSHALFDFPSKSLHLSGVTATNGKTTISHMLAHLLRQIDPKVGLIGTAGHYLPSGRIHPDIKNPVTTPFPTQLDEYFSVMRDAGTKHAVLEVSSFGLEGGRLIGYQFDVMAVANISSCHHSNFHGGQENYANIKLHALDLLKTDGIAVLNVDDPLYKKARDIAGNHKIITFGESTSDFQLTDFESEKTGSKNTVSINGHQTTFNLNLPAKVNALNALCALAMFEGLGYKSVDFAHHLQTMPEIMGRWNWIDKGQPFTVVVDKANTPEALRIVGQHMDSTGTKRKIAVICTVGEGGAEGRLEMAKVASKVFDFIIVSYDDAKDEDPDKIIEEFSGYLAKFGASFKAVPDRALAIEYAINDASNDDFVAILGRGDEDGMYLGGKWVPVDDRTQAEKALRNRGY